jgi:hypothetical protein
LYIILNKNIKLYSNLVGIVLEADHLGVLLVDVAAGILVDSEVALDYLVALHGEEPVFLEVEELLFAFDLVLHLLVLVPKF